MSTAGTASNLTLQDGDSRFWRAELNCTFESGPERTIVRRTHRGPLSMQRPFYPEGDIAHVYMLHPPGGVVAGDQLNTTVNCIPGARGLVSTPGAAKFYRSEGPYANVNQSLSNKGGSLEWFPGENIFFSGSNAKLNTKIELDADASMAWWEINCFGRQSADEPFIEGAVSSVVDVYLDSSLVFRERYLVEDQYPLVMSSGMRNNTVSGTLLLTPLQSHCIDWVREKLKKNDQFSCTHFDSMLIVRYLGDSSEEAKLVFADIWSGLRQALNMTAPSMPRIWST